MSSWLPREKPGLEAALTRLTGARGVLAGVVAAEDGLPIAVRLRAGQNGDVWAAAASAMGRIGRKALAALAKGELEVGVFDTDRYRLLVRPVNLGYLLAICEPEASVGLIAGELENAAAALERAVGVMAPATAPGPA